MEHIRSKEKICLTATQSLAFEYFLIKIKETPLQERSSEDLVKEFMDFLLPKGSCTIREVEDFIAARPTNPEISVTGQQFAAQVAETLQESLK